MIFHVCKKCKKIVWFWQNCADVTLHMKSGQQKVLHFCFDCGMAIAKKAALSTIDPEAIKRACADAAVEYLENSYDPESGSWTWTMSGLHAATLQAEPGQENKQ